MSAFKVGRNDPCPRGSGKKYKHCCLRRSEHYVEDSPEAGIATWRMIGKLAGELLDGASAEEAAELAQMQALVDEFIAFEQNRLEDAAEIDAQLAAHRREFRTLTRDEGALRALAMEVFNSEDFNPYRFSVAEIAAAFDDLEITPDEIWADETELIHAAIRHLMNPFVHLRFLTALLRLIRAYVREERFNEAWLLRTCLEQLSKSGDGEAGLFAFFMFWPAFKA